MHRIKMRLRSWLRGESYTLVMYALVSLGVRAGSITTRAPTFSLLLTARNECPGTLQGQGRKASAALWWWGFWGGCDSGPLEALQGFRSWDEGVCVSERKGRQ